MRVLFLMVLFSVILYKSSFSQEVITKQANDTLVSEEIIYEVDTVYLQPDTISVLDTVIHYTVKPARKLPFFVEISGSSFISGLFNFIHDTITIRKTINYSGGLTFAYTYKSVFWGINLGVTQLEENFSYPNISSSSVISYPNDGYRDSVLYSGICSFTNYFNYLNTAVVFGKRWTGKGKLSFGVILHAGCDILLKHRTYSILSDAENKIPVSDTDLRKLSGYFDLSVSVGYRFWKKTDLFAAPYSKLTLKSGKEYPLTNQVVFGLRLGLIKYF